MALLLKEADVQKLLTMENCITMLEDAFREQGEGAIINKPRYRVRTPKGFLHIMPGAVPSVNGLGVKVYPSYGAVTKHLTILFDYDNGLLQAIIESAYIGAIRTGAASGVATKYMAREDSSIVGLYGTGRQARTQLLAMCAVRKIKRINVFSRVAEHREAFAKEMSKTLGVEVVPVSTPEEAAKKVDIIVTATSAREPLYKGEWMDKGTHINAMGSNHWIRREIDETAIKRSNIIIADDIEDSKIEAGELIWSEARGNLNWSRIFELGDVIVGRVKGRNSPDDITLFKSNGIGMEDVAVAGHLYKMAKQQKIGQEIPL